MRSFGKNTAITFVTQISNLILGIAASIVIARLLGPKGKGVYTLAILLPSIAVTLSNLGIGPATIYYIGKGKYSLEKILGSNLALTSVLSSIAIMASIIIIVFFRNLFLRGVPLNYLFLALLFIPFMLLQSYLQNILLGLQEIKKYNLADLFRSACFLVLVIFTLCLFKAKLIGAISSLIISTLLTGIFTLFWINKLTGITTYRIDKDFVKDASSYGIKAHTANILAFLNYRFDIFLVNAFVGPIAVGYYSLAVGIAEKIWLLSGSASTVLFPRVASEKDEKRRKEFTPIVSRNVMFITTIEAIFIYFLIRWIIIFFYSKTFLPSVRPLQILLPGIIALSAARVLANDIAGRGKPLLNTYMAAASLAVNIGFNILWIPKFGIEGAALASTLSYNILLLEEVLIYSRLSRNPIGKILFIRKSDFALYKNFIFQVVKKLSLLFPKYLK
jgi:O-antigen/teichoic acid export membrane protein